MLADPANTHRSSAVGRYQIVNSTLEELVGDLGVHRNAKFTPELQNQMASAQDCRGLAADDRSRISGGGRARGAYGAITGRAVILDSQANAFATTHCVGKAKALASVWFKKVRKKRKAA